MTPEHQAFAITRIGGTARAALARGRHGTVLGVFHRSFYVELGDGVLACIGPEGMGAGPLNSLARIPNGLDWPQAGLEQGAPAHIAGATLVVANRFRFAIDGAETWSPAPPARGWTRGSLTAGLAVLRDAAGRYDLSGGLARLVVSDAPTDDMLVMRGRAGAMALRAWLSGPIGDVPSEPVAGLIGLGPGLTPSGDDLIGGAMIALGALGNGDRAAALGDWALEQARARTGKISLAHLSCAAGGNGAEALHQAIAAITAADTNGIAKAISALDGIGHSSGWDALAGAVVVMAMLSA